MRRGPEHLQPNKDTEAEGEWPINKKVTFKNRQPSYSEREDYYLSDTEAAREWLIGKKVKLRKDQPTHTGGNKKTYSITEVQFTNTTGDFYSVTLTLRRGDKRKRNNPVEVLEVSADEVRFTNYLRFPPRSKQWARQ